ncbi:MAG TPA: NADP-dependent malic enzyme [Candidatus Dormibacteraeota bacterium]
MEARQETEAEDAIFALHRGGKLRIESSVAVDSAAVLAQAYTPGVASVCRAIAREPLLAHTHSIKANTVAVVTDGTAVLGLGDIGPLAAEPVMSGKAMLFAEMAGVQAFPICLDTRDPDEIVQTVKLIAPVFGGINLEDISAPRCFEIEERLDAELDIPVFHDDQHGTAIVVMAALINALELTGRSFEDLRVVVSGIGAAGIACTKMMLEAGVTEIIGFDSAGPVHRGRHGLSGVKRWYSTATNPPRFAGTLRHALEGADLFLGLSRGGLLHREDLNVMAPDAIVMALANPEPEVRPEEAIGTPVRVFATGRSDLPNQVNNVLAFPGVFRGALDAGATTVNRAMKIAAARAIAGCVSPEELESGQIVPHALDRRVPSVVAAAVAEAAIRSGVVR